MTHRPIRTELCCPRPGHRAWRASVYVTSHRRGSVDVTNSFWPLARTGQSSSLCPRCCHRGPSRCTGKHPQDHKDVTAGVRQVECMMTSFAYPLIKWSCRLDTAVLGPGWLSVELKSYLDQSNSLVPSDTSDQKPPTARSSACNNEWKVRFDTTLLEWSQWSLAVYWRGSFVWFWLSLPVFYLVLLTGDQQVCQEQHEKQQQQQQWERSCCWEFRRGHTHSHSNSGCVSIQSMCFWKYVIWGSWL